MDHDPVIKYDRADRLRAREWVEGFIVESPASHRRERLGRRIAASRRPTTPGGKTR